MILGANYIILGETSLINSWLYRLKLAVHDPIQSIVYSAAIYITNLIGCDMWAAV